MKRRVLAVDDERVVLGAVRKALKKTEVEIDIAESAEEALQKLADTPYDVLITDLMMPGLDGLELMSRVREQGLELATVMITGYPTISTALRAKRLGAFEYVTKPFTRQELSSVVQRALRLAEPSAGDEETTAPGAGDRYAIPDHAWVRVATDGEAVVGLHRRFARSVGAIEALELPAKDAHLRQGVADVLIHAADGAVHSLHIPLSGRVLEVNPALAEDAGLAGLDPEGEGWLLRLEPEDLARELPFLQPA